ncbi:MAG: FtsH protease activity modulator HflK [Methylacidiphilales bacterium]|nr:FtsH protease activity modulator HflK [Candidatus Methylacidiphilales bacterium]
MLDLFTRRFSQGPPDLDEWLDSVGRKLKNFLSGRPNSNEDYRDNHKGSDDNDSNFFNNNALPPSKLFLIGLGILFAIWFVLGFYIVDEKERAVILRFGKYSTLQNPGIHWAPFFIDSPIRVNIKQVRSTSYSSTLLTGDENIVKIHYEVQYIVSDPIKFLFNVRNPEAVVGEVVNSTVREVIGKNTLDYVLLEGRPVVAQESRERAIQILDDYQIGITLQTINIQEAQPPEEVQNAFNDTNKAREDKQRYINEAEAYSNEVIPVARGDAQKILEGANAYKSRVIAEAEGDASRFLNVLSEYVQAPEVTERRLWLETLSDIYSRNVKVYVGNPKSGQLLYLPLDSIKKNLSANQELNQSSPSQNQNTTNENQLRQQNSDTRSRLVR